tara:strand:+ start:371 stop:4414 length:4044 start_codon:yes stop_codon:yes gene_type:complete
VRAKDSISPGVRAFALNSAETMADDDTTVPLTAARLKEYESTSLTLMVQRESGGVYRAQLMRANFKTEEIHFFDNEAVSKRYHTVETMSFSEMEQRVRFFPPDKLPPRRRPREPSPAPKPAKAHRATVDNGKAVDAGATSAAFSEQVARLASIFPKESLERIERELSARKSLSEVVDALLEDLPAASSRGRPRGWKPEYGLSYDQYRKLEAAGDVSSLLALPPAGAVRGGPARGAAASAAASAAFGGQGSSDSAYSVDTDNLKTVGAKTGPTPKPTSGKGKRAADSDAGDAGRRKQQQVGAAHSTGGDAGGAADVRGGRSSASLVDVFRGAPSYAAVLVEKGEGKPAEFIRMRKSILILGREAEERPSLSSESEFAAIVKTDERDSYSKVSRAHVSITRKGFGAATEPIFMLENVGKNAIQRLPRESSDAKVIRPKDKPLNVEHGDRFVIGTDPRQPKDGPQLEISFFKPDAGSPGDGAGRSSKFAVIERLQNEDVRKPPKLHLTVRDDAKQQTEEEKRAQRAAAEMQAAAQKKQAEQIEAKRVKEATADYLSTLQSNLPREIWGRYFGELPLTLETGRAIRPMNHWALSDCLREFIQNSADYLGLTEAIRSGAVILIDLLSSEGLVLFKTSDGRIVCKISTPSADVLEIEQDYTRPLTPSLVYISGIDGQKGSSAAGGFGMGAKDAISVILASDPSAAIEWSFFDTECNVLWEWKPKQIEFRPQRQIAIEVSRKSPKGVRAEYRDRRPVMHQRYHVVGIRDAFLTQKRKHTIFAPVGDVAPPLLSDKYGNALYEALGDLQKGVYSKGIWVQSAPIIALLGNRDPEAASGRILPGDVDSSCRNAIYEPFLAITNLIRTSARAASDAKKEELRAFFAYLKDATSPNWLLNPDTSSWIDQLLTMTYGNAKDVLLYDIFGYSKEKPPIFGLLKPEGFDKWAIEFLQLDFELVTRNAHRIVFAQTSPVALRALVASKIDKFEQGPDGPVFVNTQLHVIGDAIFDFVRSISFRSFQASIVAVGREYLPHIFQSHDKIYVPFERECNLTPGQSLSGVAVLATFIFSLLCSQSHDPNRISYFMKMRDAFVSALNHPSTSDGTLAEIVAAAIESARSSNVNNWGAPRSAPKPASATPPAASLRKEDRYRQLDMTQMNKIAGERTSVKRPDVVPPSQIPTSAPASGDPDVCSEHVMSHLETFETGHGIKIFADKDTKLQLQTDRGFFDRVCALERDLQTALDDFKAQQKLGPIPQAAVVFACYDSPCHTTAGLTKYAPLGSKQQDTILINLACFDDKDDESLRLVQLKQTLVHEFAHVVAGRGHGHDATWRCYQDDLGIKSGLCRFCPACAGARPE